MQIILNCLLVVFSAASILNAQSPSAWVASGLKRVQLGDAPGPDTSVALWAAKGEYEPVQLIVRGTGGAAITGVSVTVSDLIGPAGKIIPKNNVQLFREYYIPVSVSSPDWGGPNRPLPPGYYPDALIPQNDPITGLPLFGGSLKAFPFDVAAGQNQPVWADFYIPLTAAAGKYSGTFTVSSGAGSTVILITLTVWNFQHPVKPSLLSSISYQTAVGNTKPAEEALLQHKLTPLIVNPANESDFVNRYSMPITNLGLSSGANVSTCSMSLAPTSGTIAAAKALHSGALELYNYTADELDKCNIALHQTIRDWAKVLHAAGVPQLITITPVPDLYDDGTGTGRSAVDIWVLLPMMYDRDPAAVKTVMQKGDQVWSYNAFAGDAHSPKWLLDYDPINFRIQPGFINQSLGLKGILYYGVDKWVANPWIDQDVVNGGYHFPGDGVLVYPGQPVNLNGVVPSIRLKQLREGVEDYEYIELLKQHGSGAWALQVASGVGANWANWTRDVNYFEATRRELGQELDRLSGTPSSPGPVRYRAQPVGALVHDTEQTTVSMSTGANAICRYSLIAGTPYASMSGVFATTGGTTHSFPLSVQAPKNYVYYVRCADSSGNTNADDFVLAFNVPPSTYAQNPSPANGALAVSTAPTLTWNAVAQATSYDVYAGSSPSALNFVLTTRPPSWYPGVLAAAQTYYWKIGTTVAGVQYPSPIWSFTTGGGNAAPSVSLLSPASGTTAQSTTVTLSWSPVSGATSYGVYGGTSIASVPLITTVTASSVTLSGLQPATNYYWKVVSSSATGSNSSAVWSFTTK